MLGEEKESRLYPIPLSSFKKKKKNLKGVFVCLLLVFFFRFSFSFSTKSLLLFNALQPGFTPIGFLKAANDFHAVKFNGHFFVCVLLNFA